MTDTLSALRQVLRQFLVLSGVSVGEVEGRPIETSPLEPLANCDPAIWAYYGAFHLSDILYGCTKFVSGLIPAAVDYRSWSGDLATDLWADIRDLRFHASYFPLYASNIREKVMETHATRVIEEELLLQESTWQRPRSTSLGRQITEALVCASVPDHLASRFGQDLAGLDRACKSAVESITGLCADRNANLQTLWHRFTTCQRAAASLELALLQADLSADFLMGFFD